MAPHPELEAEQAFVDHAYERLEAMREAATSMLQDAYRQKGSTPASVNDRDVSVRTSLARLEQLEIGDEALVFGRIDTAPEPGGGLEAFHIGRLAVSDEDQEALVVDWRAPIAEPFYRATGRHPMGLSRRRHFLTHGRRVTDLEDELFGGDGPDAGLGVGGSTVLLRALEQGRTGRMRDIVATVQREQDEVIRAPLHGALVVQGGPGTGKTAVALHRAAYLLYTHRFPLERQGVLVVGPNPLFLRYIEHVLPSLGETGVQLTTIGGLVAEHATAEDTPEAARVKGDARMADVLAKAVRDRQRPLRRDVVVPYGSYRVRFTVQDSAEVVAQARRRQGGHNARRRLVESLVARRIQSRLEHSRDRARQLGLGGGGNGSGGSREGDGDTAQAAAEIRRIPEVAEALDRMWPVLLPEELLHDLFGARPLIDLAAGHLLSERERAALARPRSASLGEVRWTEGDLPLLDEARSLLGSPPRRRHLAGVPEDAGELRTFGHIVVDEAQDLTPMQLRMLGRRSTSGSMTIVGDIAQATGPFAPGSWDDQLAHLAVAKEVRKVELSVNYRTPAEIMDMAGRVLAVANPGLRVPESVRTGDSPPLVVGVGPGADFGQVLAATLRGEAERVAGGTVAVICPRSMVDQVSRWLDEGGVDHDVATARSALEATVTVLAVEVAKGLEFDAVVVVEPSRLVRESAQRLQSLFVALTRATRRLALVHAEPLPPMLPERRDDRSGGGAGAEDQEPSGPGGERVGRATGVARPDGLCPAQAEVHEAAGSAASSPASGSDAGDAGSRR